MAFNNSGKSGIRTVPKPPMRPSFVLGSRPDSLRAKPQARIKPMAGQTQYGKVSSPEGASFGDTGLTGMS